MADQDNTSAQVEAQEAPIIIDQDTFEKAIQHYSEPVENTAEEAEEAETTAEETTEEEAPLQEDTAPIFGKYKSLTEAEKAYKEMQKAFTKSQQELAELKKAERSKKLSDLKGLDYDQREEFLIQKMEEFEEFKAALEESFYAAQAQKQIETRAQSVQEFVATNPHLKNNEYLANIFENLALHPQYEQEDLEAIYESLVKPAVEKLSGTRIKVREKTVKGSAEPSPSRDINTMNMRDYEANRAKILSQYFNL